MSLICSAERWNFEQQVLNLLFCYYYGCSPLILFNENEDLCNVTKNIIILSQLNHFKTSTIAMTSNNELSSGIGGLIDNLDINTVHKTILYGAIGTDNNNNIIRSISDTIYEFGDILFNYYRKERKSIKKYQMIYLYHI